MRSFNGQIRVYRLLDIGFEIDLNAAHKALGAMGKADLFKFQKSIKSVVLEDVPLILEMENVGLEINKQKYETFLTAKIWSFGAVSINFKFDFATDKAEIDMPKIAAELSESETIDNLAREKAKKIIEILGDTIKKPHIWGYQEDYSIFIEKVEHASSEYINELVIGDYLYNVLSAEPDLTLSEQMKDPIRQSTLRYADNDLVAIDWNSSYIVDTVDTQDICDVLEFANVQLLELNYYDDLLDKKISHLFKDLLTVKASVFNRTYSRLYKDASQIYLEASEVVERIENSFKVVGDVYYARVFRVALQRFRVESWKRNVEQKLRSLIDISNVKSSEVSMTKSHLMELIIIILIAIEVIPFVFKLMTSMS